MGEAYRARDTKLDLDCVQALEPYCTVQSVIVESSFTKMRLPDIGRG